MVLSALWEFLCFILIVRINYLALLLKVWFEKLKRKSYKFSRPYFRTCLYLQTWEENSSCCCANIRVFPSNSHKTVNFPTVNLHTLWRMVWIRRIAEKRRRWLGKSCHRSGEKPALSSWSPNFSVMPFSPAFNSGFVHQSTERQNFSKQMILPLIHSQQYLTANHWLYWEEEGKLRFIKTARWAFESSR